jgi:hypothetical protein
MEWPEARPAYNQLVVDPLGIVWLRHSSVGDPRLGPLHPGDSPERWALFHPDHVYLGDLSLPPRHTLLETGEDYVLALGRDELDVESVVLLPLDRGPAEGSRVD